MNSHSGQIYIDGEWTSSGSPNYIEVLNPSTEAIIGAVPDGTPDDVDRAVAAARRAFNEWSNTSKSERARLLRCLHDGLAERVDEIAETISRDVGTPIKIARRIQAALPLTDIASIADLLEQDEQQERVGNSLIVREPAGVVAAITPWNYPLHQVTCKIAPALGAGCTVVLKPSEVAPLAVEILFEVIDTVGFPPGVINLVHGRGEVVGEALVSHPDIDVVSFTGSTAAGARVGSIAGAHIKRVALELGGKSANVILDDADLKTAVKIGVSNAFLNGGQTCTAWTRMLVPADRHDEAAALAVSFAATFVPGDPLEAATKLGPMVSAAQRDRVRSHILEGTEFGATLEAGGADRPAHLDRGYYVAPTIFSGVHADSALAQEEIFGPVLSIIAHHGDDDALEIANNSRFGLHGAVWSADNDRAMAFARKVRTGQIDVNGGAYNPLAPFGGYKTSGIGREMGRQGMDEFVETKAIQL